MNKSKTNLNPTPVQMIITDLDGTLLGPDRMVSETDFQTLEWLEEQHIVRVIATGRSPFSLRRVIPDDFPVDYVIVSSGAGVMDWSTKEFIFSHDLSAPEVQTAVSVLNREKLDFMIQQPIPESHRFLYVRNRPDNPDFDRRLQIYEGYHAPLTASDPGDRPACEIIAIIPDGAGYYGRLQKNLPDLKVIRTTSPLDGETLWVELFPADVSKAAAAKWLCDRLGIDCGHTLGIGNDYNDLDLLHWTGLSYVVGNAPDVLKERFEVTRHNGDSGFSAAVHRAMGLNLC